MPYLVDGAMGGSGGAGGDEGGSGGDGGDGCPTHLRIMQKIRPFFECLNVKHRFHKYSKCPPPGTENMEAWAEELKTLIDDLTRWHDQHYLNIGALHGTSVRVEFDIRNSKLEFEFEIRSNSLPPF